MQKIKQFLKENLFFIVFIVLAFLLCNIPLPYYILAPGGVINITDRIELDNKYETSGTLNLLYVSEYNATVVSFLASFIFKDFDLNKIEDQQVSNENLEEIDKRNKLMLENSRQNAIFVAYNYASKSIKLKDKQNIVIATTNDNNLKIGDIILSVNGINIDNMDNLKEIISKSNLDDKLIVKVLRDNKEIEVLSKVYENNGNKLIGIVMVTNYDYELDPNIKINFKASEGGSSGGLMLALNIYNALVKEDITNGHKIAGTGTIDIMGNVGAIDGVKYKIMGAYKNKMELVFVPKDNYEEAIKVVKDRKYDMKVISVDTFEDALNYLKEYK